MRLPTSPSLYSTYSILIATRDIVLILFWQHQARAERGKLSKVVIFGLDTEFVAVVKTLKLLEAKIHTEYMYIRLYNTIEV